MVLVDTSVWVDHFRSGSLMLGKMLDKGDVLCHPHIIGEIACGNIKNRDEILSLLQSLPAAKEASHEEVLQFIEIKKLMGRGLGYIDMHLLASVILSNAHLWSMDKKLIEISAELKVEFNK